MNSINGNFNIKSRCFPQNSSSKKEQTQIFNKARSLQPSFLLMLYFMTLLIRWHVRTQGSLGRHAVHNCFGCNAYISFVHLYKHRDYLYLPLKDVRAAESGSACFLSYSHHISLNLRALEEGSEVKLRGIGKVLIQPTAISAD